MIDEAMTDLNWTLLGLAIIGLIGAGWTYYHQHYRKPGYYSTRVKRIYPVKR
jgi:hypothetical protein